ncbi:hypothetical protein [Stenotrophomonas acidaminiphila]|uniref:hypothetical protein n=1 Tax=Stenotrophomonas acidaminiphila TaxID=128780 RepID=UPI00289CB97F|nr:hypothetical protein [Stenotrophomonas acidaminiphila]
MSSVALAKFNEMMSGADVLAKYAGVPSPTGVAQVDADQICQKAAVANAVGCWEGYLEAVLREFVSKVRVQANRRSWTLVVQYEAIVDKLAAELNTPSWEKARDIILVVTGMDPYASWIWSPKFTNQNDTKEFFDGVMKVRHAFAHGFRVPNTIPGVAAPGMLDPVYVQDVFQCVRFFAEGTDSLLEHELTHRHSCPAGWA